MHRQFRNYKFYIMLFADALLFSCALYLAYLFRFDFNIPSRYFAQFVSILPIAIPIKSTSFFLFGLYRGMWRYTDLRDSWRLLQACLMSSLGILAVLLFWDRFTGYPRSVFILDFLLTFLFCGGLRVIIRTMYLHKGNLKAHLFLDFSTYWKRRSGLKRVLLIGAGNAGEKLLREIIENPDMLYEPVGFLDDEPEKKNRTIHGVQVLGGVEDLGEVAQQGNVAEVFIAIPTATGKQVRRIVEACKQCNIDYKILPGLGDLMEGKVSVRNLRDVRYEDLLGRETVRLEMDSIEHILMGKTVLVTGAGGSIGSELCRQIVRFQPKTLILLDSSEEKLYAMQMELRHEFHFTSEISILGRVQDEKLIKKIFSKYSPQIVFHAAAYKHVPMLEGNPWEAVFTNIIGSRVVMAAADEFNAERFVLVSTDKAVRPTNVMGATKRATEIIMQTIMKGSSTKFMAVRFGNVVGSSGSVIPLFRRQIEHGGPVTVTHPEVTRYFMTIPEACQLILQTGAMGEGGEIFILEMGTPVKIADMARDLIRLSGRVPDEDIEIVFTGLRPGEKLYEELITYGEGIVETRHEKIMVLRPESDHDQQNHSDARLDAQIQDLLNSAINHDMEGIKQKLTEIVPEYARSSSKSVL
jgi:FlaA1/EpsC-like NDP-sugar epimerase